MDTAQLDLFDQPAGKSLAEARRELFAELDDGAVCPCCDQYAQRYRRPVDCGMARCLILAYRLGKGREDEGRWVHVSELAETLAIVPTIATTARWGLAESRKNTDTKKKDSGWWRLTDLGVAFVLGETTVPKYAVTWNGVNKLDGDPIGIVEALGRSFNYPELMRGI
jgi:hypothetical protein